MNLKRKKLTPSEETMYINYDKLLKIRNDLYNDQFIYLYPHEHLFVDSNNELYSDES